MIKAIAMGMGFAEGAKLGWLIYESETKFKTRKAALESLTLMLYAKFWSGVVCHRDYAALNPCCRNIMRKDKDAAFCSKCGKQIVEPDFSVEEFEQFLFDLSSATNDGAGYEEDTGEIENPDGWCSYLYNFSYTRKNMLIIQEQAEIQIAKMLARIKPELFEENPDYGKPDPEHNGYEGTEIALDAVLASE